MPSEDRRIIFSNDEVYKAIFALCTQKNLKKPPAGRVVALTEDKDDPNKIYMELEDPQADPLDQTERKKEYSRDFLAAALMLFCRGCGIPLPKSAKKAVLIKDSKVMLRVTI